MEFIQLTTPYTIVMTNIASSFKIEMINLVLFESATFRIMFYDDSNELLEIKIIAIEGENYLNWKNDDQFVVDYIKTQLNIS